MYTGININETKKHSSKNDPDKENPTIFHLGALDSFVKAYIEDNSTEFEASSSNPEEEAKIKILFAKRNLLIVKFGLRKIENFVDPETKRSTTFEAKKMVISGISYLAMPDENIAMLAEGALIAELANEILKLNSLSPEEIKN
jgi:hypothetical protein